MYRSCFLFLAFIPFFTGCGMFSTQPEQPTTPEISSSEEVSPVAADEVDEPALPSAQVSNEPEQPMAPQLFEPGTFENPEKCANCHRGIYDEWSKSMHANAWQNRWYQPDFLLAHQETDGATDLLCGACHAPIAARTDQLPPADGSQFDATSKRGISCDFCHTVTAVGQMFNMGHISEPGNVKIGPRGDGRSLYHQVKTTGLHRQAEFCGSCHMVIHPATGVHIIDTWQDWQNNPYGQQGISCQNCHMTPTPGVQNRPGRAALLGKKRDNLAYHGFIGGSSYVQDAMGNHDRAELSREFLLAAAELKLVEQVSEDGTLELTVEVHNVGAGHKIPTGTTYIRMMWLQVEVVDSNGEVVYRSGQIDANNHVDPDAAFFRVLFRDVDGNLTGKSWRAHGIGYDRRIPAKGMDSESYRIALPDRGEYRVVSRLMYRSFSQQSLDDVWARTGQALPPVESIEMAAASSNVVY